MSSCPFTNRDAPSSSADRADRTRGRPHDSGGGAGDCAVAEWNTAVTTAHRRKVVLRGARKHVGTIHQRKSSAVMATPRSLGLGSVTFYVRLVAQAFGRDVGRRLENALENDSLGWNDSRHSTNYPSCTRTRARPLGRCSSRDQPTRRSRKVAPAVSRADARSEAADTPGGPSRRWSLSRATSRWSASTHSPTLPWFVTAESPQYGQTLFLRGGADFVTMPLDDVWAAPIRRRPQRSPRRVTAEHTRELYCFAHASRYQPTTEYTCRSTVASPGRVARAVALRGRARSRPPVAHG
jgi:hypothetical protein